MAYLILIIGLIVLVFAGDLLVRGSVTIAERLGIPPLIIGLTVVALGTSAPELVISLDAALSGAPGIALGNVVGSNIANILLVLGLPSILTPTRCDQRLLLRNTIFMLAATCVFIALAYTSPLHIWQGLILLTMMTGFLWISAARARQAIASHAERQSDSATLTAEPDAPTASGSRKVMPYVMVIAGLIGLPLGADLTVTGAKEIAHAWGMSDTAIGLTVVAIGTSLPELAATAMAAIRRESAIAVGNVIGSNIFNLLAIMGITSIVAPVPVAPAILHVDIWVMLAASLLILPFIIAKIRIGRVAGIAFVAIYIIYVAMVIGGHSTALAMP